MNSLRSLVHLSRHVITVLPVQWQQSVRLMCSDGLNKLAIKQPGKVSMDSPEVDWEKEMMEIYEEEEKDRTRSILAPVADESKVYAEPAILPSYNLAAYVQKSENLQKMIEIGIDLHKLEYRGHAEFVAKLDFKHDIEPYILLLCKDIGIKSDDLAHFFTKNILILEQSFDDIHTRLYYLQSKRFTKENIVSIVTRCPTWLNYSTKDIDKRFGYFQNLLDLTATEVRSLTLERPRLIISDLDVVRDAHFSFRDEFGFENPIHLKKIILKCPVLLECDRYTLMDRYDYVNRVMKIDNNQLVLDPLILTKRIMRIKERHGFLKKIRRAQYNPLLPLYVSPSAMCTGNDLDFCENIAKRPYEDFDEYLRTL